MNNDDDLFFHRPTHPPCEQHDGMPCESCNELTDLEAQMQDLLKRHRNASVTRNRNHSPLIHRFPLEIVAYIFTLAFPPRSSHPCCVIPPAYWPPRPKPCNEPSPLILAKVCHTWRVFALSTPALWSDICVDAEKPNLALLNYHVAHSSMAPLSIHLFSKSNTTQVVPGTEQAMSIVMKELHRAASLYFEIRGDQIRLFNTLSDLDLPKAAPLLNELHAHVPDKLFSVLRLAIEPPRPRHVVLEGIPVNNVVINWTNLASLELDCLYGGKILHEHLSSGHLKRLALGLISTQSLAHIVNRSIEDLNLSLNCSVNFMLTGSTLPLLRRLYLNFGEMHVACALLSDFLRRSACPLQDLTICNWDGFDAPGMLALANVLKTTTNLRRLSLIPAQSERTDHFDWFIRQLSSRDRSFLPSLQKFHMQTYLDLPPYDLLLDMMESVEHPSEGVLPLQELILDRSLASPDDTIIPRDDLLRILRLRAAGKTISVLNLDTGPISGPLDMVEYWKGAYDIGEQW